LLLAQRFTAGLSSGYHREPARRDGEVMFDSTTTVIMVAIIVFIYMLPTIVAYGREHPRRLDIAVLNILFGWTLIGWFACFFWAALARVEPQLG
jgi:hypothetical protein